MYKFESDILAVCGPTACGKSGVAIKLALENNAEIVNADAFALYCSMDIGTAKPSKAELSLVRHHLVDVIDYDEAFDVRLFQKMARGVVDDILSRGKKVIIVGGSNLYLQSILYQYQFEENPHIDELKKKLELESLETLQKKVENKALNNSEINNKKRLVNIVAKEQLGIKSENVAKEKYYQNFEIIAIKIARDKMYEQINSRVDLMFESGLVSEVKQFDRTFVSQQAIGYKEVHDYLDEKISYEEMVENVKKNTRHFAKRQMSWLNNQIEVKWYDKESL